MSNITAYKEYCPSKGIDCIDDVRNMVDNDGDPYTAALTDFHDWEDKCLECNLNGYVHGSIIFNTFIFCQFFNEYTARNIFDEWNCFRDIHTNTVFLMVSLVTLGCQIFLIEVGGEFLKTSPLNLEQWLITIALGAIGLPLGVVMRWIPVKEDPNSFFDNTRVEDALHHHYPESPHNGESGKGDHGKEGQLSPSSAPLLKGDTGEV